ncbi:MAG: ATP/GTP-binding protein, partial [Solirubrobacteraceae bacterium]
FVERAGMVICGGLPRAEMAMLTQVVPMSESEQKTLVEWQDPPAWTSAASSSAPPGRGNFLCKVGGRPGIPIHVALTDSERDLNDTNKRWHQKSRIERAA